MKFVPQIFKSSTCGYPGQIITEDIPSKNITVQHDHSGKIRLIVSIECPLCRSICTLEFEEIQWNGEETLFKCTTPPNVGLEMWRLIKNGIAMQPVFQPNRINRSALEEILDYKCCQIADHLVKWKNNSQPGRQLVDILKEVDDYTQQESWKNFTNRHYMVAMCATNTQNPEFYRGFSGRFDTVNNKNANLRNEFICLLGGIEETESELYCKNKIGHCAEVHAANSCMNNDNSVMTYHLQFSIAYQCRTARPRSYCLNCITLFDTLRNG